MPATPDPHYRRHSTLLALLHKKLFTERVRVRRRLVAACVPLRHTGDDDDDAGVPHTRSEQGLMPVCGTCQCPVMGGALEALSSHHGENTGSPRRTGTEARRNYCSRRPDHLVLVAKIKPFLEPDSRIFAP